MDGLDTVIAVGASSSALASSSTVALEALVSSAADAPAATAAVPALRRLGPCRAKPHYDPATLLTAASALAAAAEKSG